MDFKLVFFGVLTLVVEGLETEPPPPRHRYRLGGRNLSPQYRRVQREITYFHNKMRSSVKPPASDMLLMKWTPEGRKSAQIQAKSCWLHHRRVQTTTQNHLREHSKLGPCGQNQYFSKKKIRWASVLKSWFSERQKFPYGSELSPPEADPFSNYTQMVWSTSNKVGCGFAACPDYFAYVCHYCPVGRDKLKLGRPYREGRPCGSCPGSCSKQLGLCLNSCPWADMASNCDKIHRTWPDWLCRDKSTSGLERAAGCKATCFCDNTIH